MAKQLNNPQASTVYPVTEEWLVESEAELAEIPASAPFGVGGYGAYRGRAFGIYEKLAR